MYHELLDDGVYLASVSTMYRVLREHDEVHERRRQAVHPARVKPELVATKPNSCWSWDITKLHGPAKWTYYYLYGVLDIFSRYVAGWLIAERESMSSCRLRYLTRRVLSSPRWKAAPRFPSRRHPPAPSSCAGSSH